MPIVTSFRYIILYTNPTYCTTTVVLTVRRLSSLLYDNCHPYCTTTVVLTVRRVSSLLCDDYRPYCATTVVLTVRQLSSLLFDNCRPYYTTTIRLIVRFFFIINIIFFGKTIQVYFFLLSLPLKYLMIIYYIV